MGLSNCLPVILKVYVEASTTLSHVNQPDGLSNIALSQGCVLKSGSHCGNNGQNRRHGRWGATADGPTGVAFKSSQGSSGYKLFKCSKWEEPRDSRSWVNPKLDKHKKFMPRHINFWKIKAEKSWKQPRQKKKKNDGLPVRKHPFKSQRIPCLKPQSQSKYWKSRQPCILYLVRLSFVNEEK